MTTDVNAAFAASRTSGWDQGEYAGRDGLDTSAGTVALYTSTPAWHGLGQVVPGGTTSVDEVLKLGQINWSVEKRAVRYHDGQNLRTMDGKFVTVRDDTGAPLGVVGNDYRVAQNADMFGFLQLLVDNDQVIWESAGALKDGRNVFITMRLPDNVVVDPGGLNDEIVPFICALNSHDGTSRSRVVVTPWRIVCRNTERLAVQDAVTEWGFRHSGDLDAKVAEARDTLGLTVAYYERFAAEETALARADLALGQFHDLIGELWPTKDEPTARERGTAERRTARLDAMFRAETERAGYSAYAAERVVTDYLDHVTPRRPPKGLSEELTRAGAALLGTDDDLKTRAHRRLMTLTRR